MEIVEMKKWMNLKERIKAMMESEIKNLIDERMESFREMEGKSNDEWFSELCYCILTANSSAKVAIRIQKEIGKGFMNLDKGEISKELKKMGYRFYNRRAEFIVEARKFANIKANIKADIKDNIKSIVTKFGAMEAREWLVKNVNGIGYKEASHFLRNVGYDGVAILDRHILSVMLKNGLIDEIPNTLNKEKYLEIEKKFGLLAKSLGISLGELDLYCWYIEKGKVLK